MKVLHDISKIEDIQLMVDSFYEKVRKDELLGPVFKEKIGEHWDNHLDTMYRFWEGILLQGNRYNGRPFPPHATLPIGQDHFERWLQLFTENIESLFEGPKAEEAKLRAFNIANVFLHKLAALREGDK